MRLIKDNVERIANTPAQMARLQTDGYKPVDGGERCTEPDVPPDMNEMDIKALKALAKEKGLDGCSGLNKTELLAVLKDVV